MEVKIDTTALFSLSYGLYVVTSNDAGRDNGLIVNTVMQVADSPQRIAVTINKANFSHNLIVQSGMLNVNCISTDAPFSLFERFGFVSGRSVDKFAGMQFNRSENGLIYLPEYTNAMLSLKLEDYVNLDSHGMFICSLTEAQVLSNAASMTYSYYHKNVKPKPQPSSKKGYVCRICGYIHESDTLPADFICPICKHGAVDFEPLP